MSVYSVQKAESSLLLKELGEDLGLPLAFDENGRCLLILDDKLMISIHTSKSDGWILYGMLGEFYKNTDEIFFQHLFSLNQILAKQGHGALAFDKHNSAILYVQHISLQNTNRVGLYQALEKFTNWLEALSTHLNESEIGLARIAGSAFRPEPSNRRRFS